MSKVFLMIIAIVVGYVFMAFIMTEIGQMDSSLDTGYDDNSTDNATYLLDTDNTAVSVMQMLWNAATFQIDGVPSWINVLIFAPLNLILLVAVCFLVRGVG